MNRTAFALAIALLLGANCRADDQNGSALANVPDPEPTVTVNGDSPARQVLASIPSSAAMERFEMLDEQGRVISYVALTETDVGGLVFIDQKLAGTVSRHDAQAFYSCRGYATATQRHWATEASAWSASLLASAQPAASDIVLKFTGKASFQSIREAIDNPAVGQVRSLLDVGNPFGILRTLNQAREDSRERGRKAQVLRALSAITPGADESGVAAIVKPDDVSFVSGGLVMAYPLYSLEFFVAEGRVRVAQQPSFHQLARDHAAFFYVPGTQWTRCTPQGWKSAQK